MRESSFESLYSLTLTRDRQSDNGLRQLVEMQGIVLMTLLQQSRINRRANVLSTEDQRDRRSIISTNSSLIPNAQLDFEENLINSRAYQQVLGRLRQDMQSQSIPQIQDAEEMSLLAVASLAEGDPYLEHIIAGNTGTKFLARNYRESF